jgi:LysR family transcriptional regulator, low CO2-responsive transcriptional regulator
VIRRSGDRISERAKTQGYDLSAAPNATLSPRIWSSRAGARSKPPWLRFIGTLESESRLPDYPITRSPDHPMRRLLSAKLYPPMDFDQLETFLEVARHTSFSRAAEKRFRTQPAISSQIRALEEEVGARLFDRSGGKVALTAAGKVFQQYAEQTLEARKGMMVTLAELERIPRGEIVVGANEGTCLHILPEVFAEFKKLYPNVAVQISRLERAKILESIIDNSVDFGVVSTPVDDKRLTVVNIHRDELVIIAPPGHPLSHMKQASIADAARFPLLLPKVGRTRDALENLFHEHRLKPRVSMELDSSELLKRFVAADVGVGFIARSNILEDAKAGVLAAVPLADASIRRDLALVFRKDKALSRAALAFIEVAVKLKTTAASSV